MTYAEFVGAMLDLAEKGLETVLRERGEHMPQWLLDKRKSDRDAAEKEMDATP